jgi:hypothetical protein
MKNLSIVTIFLLSLKSFAIPISLYHYKINKTDLIVIGDVHIEDKDQLYSKEFFELIDRSLKQGKSVHCVDESPSYYLYFELNGNWNDDFDGKFPGYARNEALFSYTKADRRSQTSMYSVHFFNRYRMFLEHMLFAQKSRFSPQEIALYQNRALKDFKDFLMAKDPNEYFSKTDLTDLFNRAGKEAENVFAELGRLGQEFAQNENIAAFIEENSVSLLTKTTNFLNSFEAFLTLVPASSSYDSLAEFHRSNILASNDNKLALLEELHRKTVEVDTSYLNFVHSGIANIGFMIDIIRAVSSLEPKDLVIQTSGAAHTVDMLADLEKLFGKPKLALGSRALTSEALSLSSFQNFTHSIIPGAHPCDSLIGQKICNACSKTLKTAKRCARCKLALYCDAQCQKAHWPKHKNTCVSP